MPAYGYVLLRFVDPLLPPSAWPANRLPLATVLHPSGSADVSGNSDLLAVQAAQMAWNGLNVSSFAFAAPAVSTSATLNDTDGQNSVLWDETGSVFAPGDSTMATTVIRVDVSSAAIQDADTVFNGVANLWSTASPTPAGKFDIQATAFHEMGHTAGLDHAPLISSALCPRVPAGSQSFRTPSSDDRRGLAALYPEVDGGSGSQALAAGEGDLARAMGGIAGRVATGGNRSVHGAQVLALDADGNVTVSALTAPDGTYVLTGLPAGAYQVLVEPVDGSVAEAEIGTGRADNFLKGYPAVFLGGNDAPIPVTVSEGSVTGGVDLTVARADVPETEPNDTAASADASGPASPSSGALNPSADGDYYSFSVDAGEILLLDVDSGGDGNPLDPVLTVYDPSGVLPLISVDDTPGKGLDPRIGRRYTSAGTYYARVTGALSGGGAGYDYTLSVEPCAAETEPNGTPATAVPIVYAQRRGAIVDSPGDVDFYQLSAAAGDRLHAEVTAARSGSPLDPGIALLASDGSTVLASASDTFGKDPSLDYVFPSAPASGIYYLKVDAQGGAGTGAWYCLALDRVKSRVAATGQGPVGSGVSGVVLDPFPRRVDPGSAFDLVAGGFGISPGATISVTGGGVTVVPTGGPAYALDAQGRGLKAVSVFVSSGATPGARSIRVQDGPGWESVLAGALVIRPSGAPGEVGGMGNLPLRWAGNQMTWSPIPGAAGYDLYRGDLSGLADLDGNGLADSYGAQLACGLQDVVAADPAQPAPESGFFYLVVAANTFGKGSLGFASNGLERPLVSLNPVCP